MKSITVSTLAFFVFAVAARAVGCESTMELPGGSRLVVPTPETKNFKDSFESARMALRDAFSDCRGNCSTSLLWSVAECLSMACPVSTNDFAQESLEAIKEDERLAREGKIQRSPVLLKRRTTPNVAKVARKHRLLEEWNYSVRDFRRQLLAMASDSLKDRIGNLDGPDRQRYVESFVGKAKLNLDEKSIVLKMCGEANGETSCRQSQSADCAGHDADAVHQPILQHGGLRRIEN